MHWIDWTIVLAVLAGTTAMAIYTKRFTRSVADFLVANRCAGRYLLSISEGMSSLGAISVIAIFEMYYSAGFTPAWWSKMMAPLAMVLAMIGFVSYRYRETRCMTMAQYFEVRYSKRVRIFAGSMMWLSGIINFGVFPAVGARFFIYFCGLPETIPGLGLSTFAGVMIFLLCISLFFVFLGGQIAVMVTDFLQGIFTNVVLLVILGFLCITFDWSSVIETLCATPAEESLIHPFHTSKMDGFNYFYFIIGTVASVYGIRAWQGTQGYFAAAKSAHEQKMAGIIGGWRGVMLILMLMLVPVGAYVVMHSPVFVAEAADVTLQLNGIENETIRTQMTVPLVLARILPTGIVGLFCAMMLAAFISTHDTYMHSWGSIFVQDVIRPLRKKEMSPKEHLWWLRGSIFLVAVFIFFFSLLFKQTEFILMFFAATGSIWLGGAGALIIGGLYWKHASAVAASATLAVSGVLGFGGLVMRANWETKIFPWLTDHPDVLDNLTRTLEGIAARVNGINWQVGPEHFPIDSQWYFFLTILLSITTFVGLSLLEWLILRRPAFDLDRMLHRGAYAVAGDHEKGITKPATGWRAIKPSKEFTRGDRFLYYALMTWTLGWWVVFIIGTVYNLTHDVSDKSWANYWAFYAIVTVMVGVGTTIWFMIGGLADLRSLFKTLASAKRDVRDDGRVADHHILTDDEEVS